MLFEISSIFSTVSICALDCSLTLLMISSSVSSNDTCNNAGAEISGFPINVMFLSAVTVSPSFTPVTLSLAVYSTFTTLGSDEFNTLSFKFVEISAFWSTIVPSFSTFLNVAVTPSNTSKSVLINNFCSLIFLISILP